MLGDQTRPGLMAFSCFLLLVDGGAQLAPLGGGLKDKISLMGPGQSSAAGKMTLCKTDMGACR